MPQDNESMPIDPPSFEESNETATATPELVEPIMDRLPPYAVLLHNDEVTDMLDVIETITDVTPLNRHRAVEVMIEAHMQGVSLVLTTHRELAELYMEQFESKGLTVTIEPAR